MSIRELKEYLTTVCSHVTFEYNGFNCGIDPLSRNKFDIWYGSDMMTVNSIDEVMTTEFFAGKSLEDIWDDITELDY